MRFQQRIGLPIAVAIGLIHTSTCFSTTYSLLQGDSTYLCDSYAQFFSMPPPPAPSNTLCAPGNFIAQVFKPGQTLPYHILHPFSINYTVRV